MSCDERVPNPPKCQPSVDAASVHSPEHLILQCRGIYLLYRVHCKMHLIQAGQHGHLQQPALCQRTARGTGPSSAQVRYTGNSQYKILMNVFLYSFSYSTA